MTTTPGAGLTLATHSGGEGQTWDGIALGFAAQIVSQEFQRGDLGATTPNESGTCLTQRPTGV